MLCDIVFLKSKSFKSLLYYFSYLSVQAQKWKQFFGRKVKNYVQSVPRNAVQSQLLPLHLNYLLVSNCFRI